MNRKLICVGILLFVIFAATLGARAGSKNLNITPRMQETSEWCWLTVGQMVFEHYRIPALNSSSFQCGIVAAFAGPQSVCWRDCRSCPFPAGSFQNINRMLDIYPKAVNFLTGNPVSPMTSFLGNLPLSKSQIKAELDHNRPVIVGISPSGFPQMVSEHVALIVGYDENENGALILTINDPFPYDAPMFARLGNPYNRARAIDNGDGSYTANYDTFKNGLFWHESIYGIKPFNGL